MVPEQPYIYFALVLFLFLCFHGFFVLDLTACPALPPSSDVQARLSSKAPALARLDRALAWQSSSLSPEPWPVEAEGPAWPKPWLDITIVS